MYVNCAVIEQCGNAVSTVVSSRNVVVRIETVLDERKLDRLERVAAEGVRQLPSIQCVVWASGIVVMEGRDILRECTFAVCDGKFVAAATSDSSLWLVGPNLKFVVPFYGDVIRCCAISKEFKLAVCATVERHLVFVAIYRGEKVNVVKMDAAPQLLAITKGWGFVVVYAVNDAGRWMFVFDVNGRMVRKVELQFAVACWGHWTSREGFDYVVLATPEGRVFDVEVFYGVAGEPVYRMYRQPIAVAYFDEMKVIAAVSRKGELMFVPAELGKAADE
jgi:hypothetical protein